MNARLQVHVRCPLMAATVLRHAGWRRQSDPTRVALRRNIKRALRIACQHRSLQATRGVHVQEHPHADRRIRALRESNRARHPARGTLRSAGDGNPRVAGFPLPHGVRGRTVSGPVRGGKAEEDARAQAAKFLAFVREHAAAAGVPCYTVVATNNHPYDAIVNIANERGCDLIVMTSRYRKGLASVIMGSEATRVLHRASIPVLTFRALMSADHPDRGTHHWFDLFHKKRDSVTAV